MKYVLDTNIITAFIKNDSQVIGQLAAHANDEVYLCQPVYYEALRGLLWKQSVSKIVTLKKLQAKLGWLQLRDVDWEQAARLWADAVRKGKQLADVDLLLAAIAMRHKAVHSQHGRRLRCAISQASRLAQPMMPFNFAVFAYFYGSYVNPMQAVGLSPLFNTK